MKTMTIKLYDNYGPARPLLLNRADHGVAHEETIDLEIKI
jgi:hypothetical protein